MSQVGVKGTCSKGRRHITFALVVWTFEEDNMHYVYAPALELYGYDSTPELAKKSFEIALENFLEYTSNKKTLHKVLTELGWTKHKKKLEMPDIRPKEHETLREILKKPSYQISAQSIQLPVGV